MANIIKSIFTVETVSDLCALVSESSLSEIFIYKASFSKIDDPKMHLLKSQYIDARKCILEYLNDESVMDTPLNEVRDAEHGWDGVTTVRDIALTCQYEGFEYGLLDKSSFLGVDDPVVHKLIQAYASSHYALLEYLGVEFVRTNPSVFIPMS